MNSPPSYVVKYVRQALRKDVLSPPDVAQAAGFGEVLIGLHEAHKKAGKEGARTAWDAIKRLRPELQTIERNTLVRAAELKLLVPPEYAHPNFPLYLKGMNLVAGASGGGKTFFVLYVCGHFIQNGLTVVYIVGEGLAGFAARLEVLKAQLGIPDEMPRLYFNREPVQLRDANSVLKFKEELEEEGVRPNIIVVDTLARCAIGVEENSNTEVGVLIDALEALCTHYDCGVVMVHHTGKGGKIRGASALEGACDSVLVVTHQDNGIKVSNSHDEGGKNKHNAEHPPLFFELVPKTIGEWNSAVLVPTSSAIFSPKATGELTASQKAILEALESEETGLKVKQISTIAGIPQSTAYYTLNQLKGSGFARFDETKKKYVITEDGRKRWKGE